MKLNYRLSEGAREEHQLIVLSNLTISEARRPWAQGPGSGMVLYLYWSFTATPLVSLMELKIDLLVS